MAIQSLFALMGFAFVMSVSPGPGNFLLLASGVNFGFWRSLPLVLGISLGFLSMVLGVGLGLGQLLESTPWLYAGLQVSCGLYVVWLAWKISRSRSLGPDKEEVLDKPISFIQAALFQLLNPKAWAVALIVTVSYGDPDGGLMALLLLILVFALVNLPSISLWALSGVALKRLLGQGRRVVVFNHIMALLLIVTMIPALFAKLW
ncbi:LysE family translocator [Rhodovibrionaceae bacterium A322]